MAKNLRIKLAVTDISKNIERVIRIRGSVENHSHGKDLKREEIRNTSKETETRARRLFAAEFLPESETRIGVGTFRSKYLVWHGIF